MSAADASDEGGVEAHDRARHREVGASSDMIEGATAFVEKREPVWGDPIDLE